MRTSTLVVPVLTGLLAFGTPTAARAQRLFARVGTDLYELHATPDRLGRLAGQVALPGGCPDSIDYPAGAWSVLRGRYLAWNVQNGICLVDVLAGRSRSVPVPDDAPIVAASDTSFALVMARGAVVHILADPAGPLVSRTIPRTHPLKGFATQPWSYSIAPIGRRLVVVQGDDDFPTPSGPALVTTLSLATGAIEYETTVAVPLAWNAFADPSGDHVLLLSGDTAYRPGNGGGAYLARTADGTIVDARPGVTPNRELVSLNTYGVTNDGRHRLLWHEDSGRVIGVTAPTASPVTIGSLVDVGAPDVPRPEVPPPTFIDNVLRYRLWVDAGRSRLLALENEWHTRSYHGGPCVRSTLTAVPAGTNAPQRVDLQSSLGRRICEFNDAFVFVSTPSAPGSLSADVRGRTVTLTWSGSAGATHYVLEAGSAAGLANLATITVPGTSLTVTGVPPGRYYLRVRAVGVGGQGPRSANLPVTVP